MNWIWTEPEAAGTSRRGPSTVGESGALTRQDERHPHSHPLPEQCLCPAAFAIVRDKQGRVLLVRRADNGYWGPPGGRIEAGESVSAAAVRKVACEAGIDITLTGLAGIYSDDLDHAPVNPAEGARQQPAVCFHAIPSNGHRGLPNHETTTVAWHCPADIPRLTMHPTVRKRLTEAMERPATTSATSPHDQSPLTNELLRQ
jgi:8-oxo-dGTP pyrophosphatase MutT (NUDIX family)